MSVHGIQRRTVSVTALGSVSLAGLAAHLPEIWPAAELEPEHQGAVSHSVHIFTLCRGGKKKEEHMHVSFR